MGELISLNDKNSTIEAINKMGEEDLRFLNKLIVNRLKWLVDTQCQSLLAQFHPGDRVHFQNRAGDYLIGTVVRINKKTISVSTEDHEGWWNVSPGLLKPLLRPRS
ncbi:MAG: hypothetical protein JW795_13135 [Chitinivibrionales bacterium]|nr:hypothetical protein [Chitinivibrionales bacterium]